jgi:hypothetical protein
VKILETMAQTICQYDDVSLNTTMNLGRGTDQEESQTKNDEDWHFFSIRHVHLPQCGNDDQQDGQVGGDVKDCLDDFVGEIRGALLLRRWNGEIS